MTFNIKPASEIQKKKITYLLYAPPGTGKTHTINFLEGKTLYISVDKTEYPLRNNPDVDILDFNTHEAWNEYAELAKFLKESDLSKYENIVIDNISELFRAMLANLGRDGRNQRVPEMRHYQQVDFFIIDSFRFMQSLGKRLVFLAWETTEEFHSEGGQILTKTVPDIRKTIRDNIAGLCQVVAKLKYNEKTETRGFYLQATNSIYAKNQLDSRKHCLQDELFNVGGEVVNNGD
ncbi:AAA family ATPase [Staphylococcus ursi]|uniref:AAA family ATPase n=1 Tax=Staphylococcus sp. MI 10-1553 TaxID=1912064 RepID=UPI0013988AFB|nr:AAA family ATPase [Staphylococcus sp. MI 10-1553]QHW36823.1 AAA family ATPase [Staphylococcus sp. MI 10-1553]